MRSLLILLSLAFSLNASSEEFTHYVIGIASCKSVQGGKVQFIGRGTVTSPSSYLFSENGASLAFGAFLKGEHGDKIVKSCAPPAFSGIEVAYVDWIFHFNRKGEMNGYYSKQVSDCRSTSYIEKCVVGLSFNLDDWE